MGYDSTTSSFFHDFFVNDKFAINTKGNFHFKSYKAKHWAARFTCQVPSCR